MNFTWIPRWHSSSPTIFWFSSAVLEIFNKDISASFAGLPQQKKKEMSDSFFFFFFFFDSRKITIYACSKQSMKQAKPTISQNPQVGSNDFLKYFWKLISINPNLFTSLLRLFWAYMHKFYTLSFLLTVEAEYSLPDVLLRLVQLSVLASLQWCPVALKKSVLQERWAKLLFGMVQSTWTVVLAVVLGQVYMPVLSVVFSAEQNPGKTRRKSGQHLCQACTVLLPERTYKQTNSLWKYEKMLDVLMTVWLNGKGAWTLLPG